jgi:hypothetical protein
MGALTMINFVNGQFGMKQTCEEVIGLMRKQQVKHQCGGDDKNDNGGIRIWMVWMKDNKEEDMVHIQCLQSVIDVAMNSVAINVGANPCLHSTCIVNIDKMVAHHLQHQGGCGGGGGDGRNWGFLIDFDPAILGSGKGDNIVIKMAIPAPPLSKTNDIFIVGAMAEMVTAVNLLTPGRSSVLCKNND